MTRDRARDGGNEMLHSRAEWTERVSTNRMCVYVFVDVKEKEKSKLDDFGNSTNN